MIQPTPERHIPEPQVYSQDEHLKEVTETVKLQENTNGPATKFIEVKTLVKEAERPGYSEADIDLIALVTMAEAEAETEYGQRLVIDSILNRVDSEQFPNTISGVIYQENQFTSMTNGRADRCYVRDDIRQLVIEEMGSRTNTEVIFFGSNGYSNYGIPMFQEGGHYFSSYD